MYGYTFSEISDFVTVNLIIIQFKCLFDAFLDGPPGAYKLFPLYQNHFKIMLRLILFENKVAEIGVGYIGTQFLNPGSSYPIERMCVWGGGVSFFLMV